CFFFQAEDGIRDRNVTGVQTCALPILDAVIARLLGIAMLASGAVSLVRYLRRMPDEPVASPGAAGTAAIGFATGLLVSITTVGRSEERRVGKEWRALWWRWR